MRLALFAATLVAATTVGYFGGIASGSGAAPRACVVGAYVERPQGLETTAEVQVPNSYPGRSKGFEVVGIASLRLYAERNPMWGWPVNASAAWHAVAKKCGANVADRAWAIFLAFPDCQIPCSYATMYYAKTPAGWRLLWAA